MRDFENTDFPYNDEERKAIEVCWESLAEDMWKDDVFGVNSRLDDGEFLEKVSNEGKWLFKPYSLREKIFECAKVTDKHWYKKKKGILGLSKK